MKKLLLVCSHLYSGSGSLYTALDQHPRIQGFRAPEPNRYVNPLDLLRRTEQRHKLGNRSAIYMDELLYNYQLQTKQAYKNCHFLYVVRRPEPVLARMMVLDKMRPGFAARYYTFRLRRLCEMAKRTPGAILLTYDDLEQGRGLDLVADSMNLKTPVEFDPASLDDGGSFNTDLLGSTLRSGVEDTYERYLYFLRNQSLRQLL